MLPVITPTTDILRLIPQRPPIVMIEELLEADEDYAVTGLVVKQENIFLKDGKLQEPGLVENIAQTAAAMTGYGALMNEGPVKTGFIGSVNKLKIYQLPEVGTKLNTTVRILNQVLNVSIIKGEIRSEDQMLAECEMKIFLED